MNCPRCSKYLKPEFPATITIENFLEFNDVNFTCENGHVYFVRIHLDDLIEESAAEQSLTDYKKSLEG